MLVAENFIRFLFDKYGKHIVYTDGGTRNDEACNVLKIETLSTFTISEKFDGKIQPRF